MASSRVTFANMATMALGNPECPNFKELGNLMNAMIRQLDMEDVDASTLPTKTADAQSDKLEVRIKELEGQLNHLTSEMERLKNAQPDISQLQSQLAGIEERVTKKMETMEEKWKGDLKELDSRLNKITEVMETKMKESSSLQMTGEVPAGKLPSPPRSPPSPTKSRILRGVRSTDAVQRSGEASEDLASIKYRLDSLEKAKDLSDQKVDALQRATDNLVKLLPDLQQKLDTMTREMNLLKEDKINDISQRLEKIELMALEQQASFELNKEDRRSLETKVSRSTFDATTEQLNRMIQELLEKMSRQEASWNTTLDRITTEVNTKVDRMDLNTLLEELEKRWREIRQQLTERPPPQTDEDEDDEAAAVRKKLMAKFNCLSCDRHLEMKVPGDKPMTIPVLPEFTPQPALKPTTPVSVPKILQRSDNRNCGGSHTAATLQKRYYTLEKDVIPCTKNRVVLLERKQLKGSDGRLYQGQEDNRLPVMRSTNGFLKITPKKFHQHHLEVPQK